MSSAADTLRQEFEDLLFAGGEVPDQGGVGEQGMGQAAGHRELAGAGGANGVDQVGFGI